MRQPFAKRATIYEQQVALLRQRGMIVDDEAEARFYLQHLNYYRLAAYWLPFEVDHTSHELRPGTRFSDVLNLYVFDRECLDPSLLECRVGEVLDLPELPGAKAARPRRGGSCQGHLKAFNDQFGNIPWADSDRVHTLITEDIPNRVAADTAYQNAMRNSDKPNARIEHDKALAR